MPSDVEVFANWFNKLSQDSKAEVTSYVLENIASAPMMEGLFSGPSGRVQGGVYSGPAAPSSRNTCPTCGR